jgi:hypothetical protein
MRSSECERWGRNGVEHYENYEEDRGSGYPGIDQKYVLKMHKPLRTFRLESFDNRQQEQLCPAWQLHNLHLRVKRSWIREGVADESPACLDDHGAHEKLLGSHLRSIRVDILSTTQRPRPRAEKSSCKNFGESYSLSTKSLFSKLLECCAMSLSTIVSSYCHQQRKL